MTRVLGWLVAGALGAGWIAPARAETPTCQAFKDALTRNAADLAPEFVRPLIVSRGGVAGVDVYDMVTKSRIDGALRCRGDRFASFEAKIVLPVDEALAVRFNDVQEAGAMAALGWSQEQAKRRMTRYSAEAADYLRGSEERGDVVVSGKVEDHLPDFMDLGLIWTRTDRTFIVTYNP